MGACAGTKKPRNKQEDITSIRGEQLETPQKQQSVKSFNNQNEEIEQVENESEIEKVEKVQENEQMKSKETSNKKENEIVGLSERCFQSPQIAREALQESDLNRQQEIEDYELIQEESINCPNKTHNFKAEGLQVLTDLNRFNQQEGFQILDEDKENILYN